jgi:tetratricopeptide (TPR) repeat protein
MRAHWQAALAALEQFELDRAQEHLERFLSQRPDDPNALCLAARTARRREAFADAEQYLDRCEARARTPELVLERALLATQQGDLDRWERSLAEGLGGPDGLLRLEALARGRMLAFRLHEAERDLDQLLRLQPGNVLALLWRGKVHETLGDADRALPYFQQAAEQAPGWAVTHRHLADLLAALGRPREAVAHYEVARRLLPNDAEVPVGLARCWQDLGELGQAQCLLDGWLEHRPDHVPALVEWGRVACRQGRWTDAENRLRRALELAPRDRDALRALALCLEGQGKTTEAAQIATRVQAIEDDMFRVTRLGMLLTERPNDAALFCDMGLTFFRLGMDQMAEQRLLRAVQLDPRNAPAHEALAGYYTRTGQPDRAAHHLGAARRQPAGRATNP